MDLPSVLSPPPSQRDRTVLCTGLRRLPPTPEMVADGDRNRWSSGMWGRRSLGGGGASSPQVPIPPGLDDARPAGALPHLRRCARAPRARKSLEGALEFVAHPPELSAIALRSPEIGGRRARAAAKRAGLLFRPFIQVGLRGVRAVATPGLRSSSASMVAAAGCLSQLLTGALREAWSQATAWWLILAGSWSVPCGAGAQAPLCRTGVFLLTRLKLLDLEHALGSGVRGSDEGFSGVPIWNLEARFCGRILRPLWALISPV